MVPNSLIAHSSQWSQVLSYSLGSESKIVAVDLQDQAPIPGVTFFRGDITNPETADRIINELDGHAQLIVCDGAPDVSGVHDNDALLQAQLLDAALTVCTHVLQPGGTFVSKLFRSDLLESLTVPQFLTLFKRVDVFKPESSRKRSAEHFIVCQQYCPPDNFVPRPLGQRFDASTADPMHRWLTLGDLSVQQEPTIDDEELR